MEQLGCRLVLPILFDQLSPNSEFKDETPQAWDCIGGVADAVELFDEKRRIHRNNASARIVLS